MYAVIIGREFSEGNVVIKDLEGGTQEIIPINEMVSRFQRNA
jgi:histidyl-tRNA synthetase